MSQLLSEATFANETKQPTERELKKLSRRGQGGFNRRTGFSWGVLGFIVLAALGCAAGQLLARDPCPLPWTGSPEPGDGVASAARRLVDRFLGFVFGLVRGVVIVGLLALLCVRLGLDQEPWWQASKLHTYVEYVGETVQGLAGEKSADAAATAEE